MLYLFHGSDEYMRSEAVASLRAAIPPDVAHLNTATLEGRKLKLHDLMVACEAMPFLAERRLVIVYDALKHVKSGKPREEIRSFLEQLPPTCDLVFVESEDIDKRNVLYTYLKKHASIEEFMPRKGAELQRWLTEKATAMKAKLTKQSAQHLIDYVGHDSRSLVMELEKLASYVGRGGRITVDTINLLVQDTHEHNLFAFIDSLSTRQRSKAFAEVRALLAEGQAATYILFMLARQIRILLGVQELAEQRMRSGDIASQLRQNPFVIKKALDQIRGFTFEELKKIHDLLLELDHATKTGRMGAEVALDVLVMEVCNVKREA